MTNPEVELQLGSINSNLYVGKSSDPYFTRLSSNTLAFNRPGASSYINQSGVGGALRFRVSNSTTHDTEAMFINSSGDIGVGTVSPTERLDVSGNVKATQFIGDGSQLTNVGASSTGNATDVVINADSDSNTSGEIKFQTVGTTQAVIDNSGNMAIGSTAASAKLDVTAASGSAVEVNMADNTASNFVLRQGVDDYINIDTTDGSEAITFGNMTTNPSFSFLGGSVGVGTSSPSNFAKLDVNGSIISTSNTLSTFNANNAGFDFIPSNKEMRIFGTSTDTVGGYITFTTGQNGSYGERLRIDQSGNVGIGTTSPSNKLDVDGSARFSNAPVLIEDTDATTNGRRLILNESTNDTVYITKYGSNASSGPDGSFLIENKVGGNWANAFRVENDGDVAITNGSGMPFIIKDSGQVGIGTISPTTLLELSSSTTSNSGIKISNSSTPNLSLRIDSQVPVIESISSNFVMKTQGTNIFESNGGSTKIGNGVPSFPRGFYSKSLAAGYEAGLLQGVAGQSEDIFRVEDSASNSLFEVSSNGNVGIGTTTPGRKLYVVDSTRNTAMFESTDDGTEAGPYMGLYRNSSTPAVNDEIGALQIAGNDSALNIIEYGRISGVIDDPTDGAEKGSLYFKTRNGATFTDSMIIDSSGNVGIGTTTPNHSLTVLGSDTIGLSLRRASGAWTGMEVLAGSDTGNSRLIFNDQTTAGQNNTGASGMIDYEHNDDSMNFRVNQALAMKIDSAGKVGVGTASPLTSLDVEQVSGQPAVNIGVASTQSGGLSISTKKPTTWGDANHRAWNILGTADDAADTSAQNDFRINYYDGTTTTNVLTLDSVTNNVGIGTTDPGTYKLKVEGFVAVSRIMDFIHGSDSTKSWQIGEVGGVSQDHFAIADEINGSGAARMVIQRTTGYVGFGTTTPDDALDVVGDIDATGSLQTDNSTVVGGTCTSDRRLKKDINPLVSTLEKVLKLRPVEYVWRPEFDDIHRSEGKEIGLIAQEVEEVFPDMVVEKEDGYKRVRYGVSLTLRVIQAIKEFFGIYQEDKVIQDRKIASVEEENQKLKSKVKDLENKNRKIQSENDAIKAYLCGKDSSAPFCQ